MYVVRNYCRRLDGVICSSHRRAFFLAVALLAVMLAGLGTLVFRLGAPAMNGSPWEAPVILDGAWRIATGQVPHRDFYNFLGDLPFYTTALGMKLGGPCMSAIDYGNVLLMVALVLPAWGALRRRTSALAAFLFSLFLGLMVITPRGLGVPFDYTDHAMMHNRQGEVFIALVGLIVFLPPRTGLGRNWVDWAEAGLAGVGLVALLGCKVSCFLVGLVFFGVAWGLGRIRTAWAFICLASAGAFLATLLTLTGIPLSDLINDYWMAACNSLSASVPGVLANGVKGILLLAALLVWLWEGLLGEARETDHPPRPWRHIIVILVIYGGAVLLSSSNFREGEMPLLALGALYVAELILRHGNTPAEAAPFAAGRHVAACLLLLLFLLPSIVTDLKTFRFVTDRRIEKEWDSPAALQSTPLADFRFWRRGPREVENEAYMGELTEGIELVRRHADPGMCLGAVLFSDPFHVALGLRPASGGMVSLSLSGISRRSHPPLARLLGNSTYLLMMRGAPRLHEQVPLQEIYGEEWDTLHLAVVEQTENYVLFKVPEANGKQMRPMQ
jgi:hypothetical protein